MRYALLLYDGDESKWANATPEEKAETYKRWDEFGQVLADREAGRGGEELARSTTATTMRKHGDEVKLVDGPFAETSEVLAGFVVVEAEDLDGALEIARALPFDVIEVRPCVAPPDGYTW